MRISCRSPLKQHLLLICTIVLSILTPLQAAPLDRLDRGTVVLNRPEGGVYIGWRLLDRDSKDVAFDVLRSENQNGPWEKINKSPIRDSSNYIDTDVPKGAWYRVISDSPSDSIHSSAVQVPPADQVGCLTIPLRGDYVFSKLGMADLNGDGRFDFVIKQPYQVTDPGVWRKSIDTFKIEAYLHDGTFLWRHDLGWNIEQGVWYSPMIVCDLDHDGKAEVAFRGAPADRDYRDEAGHVLTGPEYCTVLDGMTGKEIDHVDWPARGDIADWGDNGGNRASRHLIGAACLDGKRLSLLAMRGTYTKMLIDAYNLVDGKLEKVWSWNGDDETPPVRGQGMHGFHAADIDEDGRDELLIGGAVVDETGKIRWNTHLGHPDACYVSDIDPTRPGMEIMYGIEPAREKNAICLADARTGEIIWGIDFPTTHVHGAGIYGDFVPANPGPEFYGGEKKAPDRWLYSVWDGKLLSQDNLGPLSQPTVYWDDSLTKVIAARDGRLHEYKGKTLTEFKGRVIGMGDILGDWREEIITSVPGELRIYSTTIPAQSRRVTFMEDRLYRMDVMMQSMGYFFPPQTSYYVGIKR